MLACRGSRGPLNVRILLCNSSSLDSFDIVALAYLPGAFIIRVLVLTEPRENVLQVDHSESESGMVLTILWGGPSFCGKTHLLLNKLQLIRLDNPEQKICIITRSPEQYNKIEIEDVSVEEDLGDKSIQDFQNCCVVFDDMLDSNQKLIDPFFTRGRHNDLDDYYLSQSYFDLSERTIRNNSNIIILFQQTLKDVEHIYRDIAGFDV